MYGINRFCVFIFFAFILMWKYLHVFGRSCLFHLATWLSINLGQQQVQVVVISIIVIVIIFIIVVTNHVIIAIIVIITIEKFYGMKLFWTQTFATATNLNWLLSIYQQIISWVRVCIFLRLSGLIRRDNYLSLIVK